MYLKIHEANMNPALNNSQVVATGGPSVCEMQGASEQTVLLLQQHAGISGNVFPV